MMRSWDNPWEPCKTGVRHCMFGHLSPLRGRQDAYSPSWANRVILIIVIIINTLVILTSYYRYILPSTRMWCSLISWRICRHTKGRFLETRQNKKRYKSLTQFFTIVTPFGPGSSRFHYCHVGGYSIDRNRRGQYRTILYPVRPGHRAGASGTHRRTAQREAWEFMRVYESLWEFSVHAVSVLRLCVYAFMRLCVYVFFLTHTIG
jgi:hypothetical protein